MKKLLGFIVKLIVSLAVANKKSTSIGKYLVIFNLYYIDFNILLS